MNKVVYLEAPFKPILEERSVSVPTGETKKGLFGGEKEVIRTERRMIETGVSDSKIDGDALSRAINQAISDLSTDGYEVISITPITSGSYAYQEVSSSARIMRETESIDGGGYGYGYSFTSGILLLARKLA
jgi:hypothetical protein